MNRLEEQSWLAGLNPDQREAVTHGAGPLLIVAGAGTGKTKTLACRVARLIADGVSPDRILLLTFTRRAAEEMLRRAAQMVGERSGGRVWGGTFHAVANRLLRMYANFVGLSPEFTVMDEGDAADLMNLIRGELGFAKRDRRFPRKETLVKIYSHTVNAQKPLREVVETYFPWHAEDLDPIRDILESYGQRKKQQNVLDYDDLLLFWSALCATPCGPKLAARFEHVLVDEYQDTNAVQAEILRGMRSGCANITAVGDDAQSIYSFRAATVRNILDFPRHFPGARIVALEQNYRSTQPILAAANAVMEAAKERYTKELWSTRESSSRPALVTCVDEAEQSGAVCRHILEHLDKSVPLMRQAVLFRAGHHSAALEIELAKRNIPFHKFGGLKFIEAGHIKDVVALLRIVENPHDEVSWHRVLLWFDGVGAGSARRIADQLGVRRVLRDAGAAPDAGPANPLARLLACPPRVPASAAQQVEALRQAVAFCCGVEVGISPSSRLLAPASIDPQSGSERRLRRRPVNEQPELLAQIERLIEFYEPICKARYDNAVVRLRDLEQLVSIASRYRSRGRFITDLTLDPPNATSDLAGPPFLEEDYLILSTIHSAKGCEWDVVHILHAADGMIPSDMALRDSEGIDEERRLFYVAMTRAKDALYVYFPLRYYHRRFGLTDPHNLAQLTRFMAPPVRSLFADKIAAIESADEPDSRPQAAADRNPYARVNRLLHD